MKQATIDVVYLLIIAALAAALWRSGALIDGRSASGHQSFEELLALAVSTLGMLMIAWWLTALLLAFASEALKRRGHPQAARRAGAVSPEFMKRLAAAVLGLNLVVVPAANAGAPAAPAIETRAAELTSAGDEIRGPLWATAAVPIDEPSAGPHWHPTPAPFEGGLLVKAERAASPATSTQRNEVVVRPGDSLWSIAAAQLGPLATDAEIALVWPQWHDSNRTVIGDDPGLLIPGQVLAAPGGR